MPPKMHRCTLCGKEVSRRQSLSLEVLGAGDGRACREHELVVQLIEQQREAQEAQHLAAEEQRALQKINHAFQVMQGTALVRVMYSIHGVDPEVIYARMTYALRWSRDVITKIREQVAEQGGPQMSSEEIRDAVFTAVFMAKRQQETGMI